MADTPESEVAASWMGCSIYQNYTASEVVVQGLAGVINQKDVELIVRAQKKMLQRFEKTNEMLTNVNSLSATRLEKAQADFKRHTVMVDEMKKDLENVFKRIRSIKSRLAIQKPEAFAASVKPLTKSEAEEDDEYDVEIKRKKDEQKRIEHGITKDDGTCLVNQDHGSPA